MISTNHARLKTRLTWLKWRWLLLCLFIIGFLLTNSLLGGRGNYLVMTLISTIACAILLTRLGRPLDVTLPFWTILAVFIVGYYVKFYWLVLDPNGLRESGQMLSYVYSSSALLPAFNLTTIAFSSFCFASWFLLGISSKRSRRSSDKVSSVVYKSIARLLILIIPILMTVTFFSAYTNRILVMGATNATLPFRLAGVIFYSRIVLIPALILLLIFCGDKGNSTPQRKIGIILLFLHGLSDVFLRSSRGQLMVLILALTFLFLLRGKRLKLSEVGAVIAGFVISILLAPIVTDYRNYRIRSPNASIIEALMGSLQYGSSANIGFIELFTSGFRFIVLRVIGAEMLLAYISLGVDPLGMKVLDVINSSRGLAGYVTVDLLGTPSYVNTSLAVSFVGWFYLVGGTAFVVIGIAGFTALIWAFWNGLQRLHLRIQPIAQVLVLLWVYSIASEGTLDTQGLSFIALLASIFLCEWLFRMVEASSKSRNTLQQKPRTL